jgi:hypothetical protein
MNYATVIGRIFEESQSTNSKIFTTHSSTFKAAAVKVSDFFFKYSRHKDIDFSTKCIEKGKVFQL